MHRWGKKMPWYIIIIIHFIYGLFICFFICNKVHILLQTIHLNVTISHDCHNCCDKWNFYYTYHFRIYIMCTVHAKSNVYRWVSGDLRRSEVPCDSMTGGAELCSSSQTTWQHWGMWLSFVFWPSAEHKFIPSGCHSLADQRGIQVLSMSVVTQYTHSNFLVYKLWGYINLDLPSNSEHTRFIRFSLFFFWAV